MTKKNSYRDFSLKEILKGDFLIKEDAHKHWKFLLFLTLLALIIVTSSHIMDNKVRSLTFLNDQLKELKSQYAETHTELMKSKLRSSIEEKAFKQGLEKSLEPPIEIPLN